MTKVGSGLDSSCGFALLCKGRFPFSENFWTFRSEVKRKGQFRFIPTGIYTLFHFGIRCIGTIFEGGTWVGFVSPEITLGVSGFPDQNLF